MHVKASYKLQSTIWMRDDYWTSRINAWLSYNNNYFTKHFPYSLKSQTGRKYKWIREIYNPTSVIFHKKQQKEIQNVGLYIKKNREIIVDYLKEN